MKLRTMFSANFSTFFHMCSVFRFRKVDHKLTLAVVGRQRSPSFSSFRFLLPSLSQVCLPSFTRSSGVQLLPQTCSRCCPPQNPSSCKEIRTNTIRLCVLRLIFATHQYDATVMTRFADTGEMFSANIDFASTPGFCPRALLLEVLSIPSATIVNLEIAELAIIDKTAVPERTRGQP